MSDQVAKMSDREWKRLQGAKDTPGRCWRACLATPSPHLRWRVRGLALVLVLFLASQADWAAAQNPPPAGPTAFSPVEEITDLVLFEDLRNRAKRLYLPRYRLAVQTVSGDPQYRLRFFKQGSGWSLEVYLEKYPAPELGEAVRTAQELSHQTKALLRYDLLTKAQSNQSNAYEELAFQEVTLERGGLRAVLHLEDLQERDAVIHALENAKFDATLLVQRILTVQHRPEKEIRELSTTLGELDKKRFSWAHAGRAGVSIPPEDWEKLEEEEAALNARLQALRTVGVPTQVTLNNRVPRQPFSFDRDLHPYVFAGIIPNPKAKPQLVRRQLSWQGRYYSYFRPADQTDLWYYLPDRFVLAVAEDKQTPRLSVKFTGPAGAQIVELEYVAVPLTQSDRLKAAEVELRPTAASKLTFEPLLVDEAQLWVALPGSGSEGSFQQRSAASVDLRDGLKDQLRLTLDEFQQIYAALFSNSLLLTGEVRLDLGGSTRERIPFEARVIQQSPEALWDEIISKAVFAEYQKKIQVKTFGTVLGNGVKALLVTFQEGSTVELSPGKLEAQAIVPLPLREFILNTEDNGLYHYKVTSIRERDGKLDKTEMPSWRSSTATILYPEVP